MKKSFAKTLSWLGVSGCLVFTCTMIGGSSVVAALGTAAVVSLLKLPAYWLHEVAWERAGRKAKETQGKAKERARIALPVLCPVCG